MGVATKSFGPYWGWSGIGFTMPRTRTRIACIAALAASAALVAAATAHSDTCAQPAGTVVQRVTPAFRIYKHIGGGLGPSWYGCLTATSNVIALSPADWEELPRSASAGPFLAYVIGKDDFHTDYYVASLDTRTGRYARMVPFNPNPGGIADLVVKPNGSIAWIQTDTVNLDADDPVTVRVADTRGVRVPKHGHHVRRASLRLRGSTLWWKKGRKTYSTRLT